MGQPFLFRTCNHGEFHGAQRDRSYRACGPGLFAGYGIRELTLAYKAAALKEWSERAALGAAGVLLAALFVAMTRQILG
jgi:hypothetical protein